MRGIPIIAVFLSVQLFAISIRVKTGTVEQCAASLIRLYRYGSINELKAVSTPEAVRQINRWRTVFPDQKSFRSYLHTIGVQIEHLEITGISLHKGNIAVLEITVKMRKKKRRQTKKAGLQLHKQTKNGKITYLFHKLPELNPLH